MEMSGANINNRDKSKKFGIFSSLAVGVIAALYIAIIVILYTGITAGWIGDVWTNLEGDGRASVISSIITAIGLISSAIILPFVFNDRVSNLNDMVESTEDKLSNLSDETSSHLQNLTKSFAEELEVLRRHSDQKAEESQELIGALYMVVSATLGEGQITDSRHAQQVVKDLWQKVKIATSDHISTKKYLQESTREDIRNIATMSDRYLEVIEGKSIINTTEKRMILDLRRLHYAHKAPSPDQFGLIRELQKKVEDYVEPRD